MLQPEMKKIQQKYKDNKEKQNEEVMKFMQENKVNPLAGCVPLLIQFPILLGVFRMLKDAEYFGITELANFNPYLFPFLAGTSFDWSNLLLIDNFYILPAIAGITTYLYSRLTMTDPNQKMFLYMMPAMIFYFGLKLPSGLVLYWVINNFLSIGQHYYPVSYTHLAGYYSMEVWGGATFDSCMRFLDEDPWERLNKLKLKLKDTKLQMLLRGQNLLGYKHYPDDVVEEFVLSLIHILFILMP